MLIIFIGRLLRVINSTVQKPSRSDVLGPPWPGMRSLLGRSVIKVSCFSVQIEAERIRTDQNEERLRG